MEIMSSLKFFKEIKTQQNVCTIKMFGFCTDLMNEKLVVGMNSLAQLSFENEPINIHGSHFTVHQVDVDNRFSSKVQSSSGIEMWTRKGNKEMEEFKKIWDKGIVYLKSSSFLALHFKTRLLSALNGLNVMFTFFFSLCLQSGLEMSQVNPNVREKFDHLCATDPKRAKELMEHPHVQWAKNELEKAIESTNENRQNAK